MLALGGLLLIAGVVLVRGIFFAVPVVDKWIQTGSVHEALGLQLDLSWQVEPGDRITRTVRLSGPKQVLALWASALGVDESGGWQRPPDAPGEGSAPTISFTKTFVPGDHSWQLTEVLECKDHIGFFHREVTYRERFLPAVLLEHKPAEAEGLRAALEKIKAAGSKPLADFVRGIPVRMSVSMPGSVREAAVLVVSADGSTATYCGELGPLVGSEVRVVSSRVSPVVHVAIAVVIVALMAVGGIWYYRRAKTAERLRKLRAARIQQPSA